jgi:hypothetical protein
MTTETLVISDTRILAEFIRQDKFKTIFEKRIGVPPDHMALLIRNGEFVDAYIGGHFSFGGLVHRLKGLVGGSHHIGLVLADLKTFQVQTPVRAITRDKVEIVGVASIDLQINPERPQDIVGLMSSRKTLAKVEVLERLKPHLTESVFAAAVMRVDAEDIRGNIGLQDKIQADVLEKVEQVAGDLGLLIRAVSVEWAMNEREREAMDRAATARAEEQLVERFEMAKRDAARQMEAYEFNIASDIQLKKLQAASEDEIAHMVLSNELKFIDAREAGQRKAELASLEHEILVLKKETDAQYANALAAGDQDIAMMERKARLAAMQLEVGTLEARTKLDMLRLAGSVEQEIHDRKNESSLKHLRGLQELEADGDDRRADTENKRKDAETQRNIAELNAAAGAKAAGVQAFAGMSPEQILAIQSGVSPEVAKVLAERARAEGQSNAQSMALMREMVEMAGKARIDSEAQARAMFDMGIKGAVGVAAGPAGRPAAAVAAVGEAPAADVIDCPKCQAHNKASTKFCTNCGHELRN